MIADDGRERGLLRYLIFFVTSRCNARCQTCFYWREMENAAPDLSLEEIDRIAGSLGRLPTLLLSGGEPTLRDDLPEIVEIFRRRTGVGYVGLPVNGLLPQKTRNLVEAVMSRCQTLRLDVNVSLDDLGERHDAIRGVAGNFERALETIRLVGELRRRFDNLRVNVETVLFDRNWRHIPELLDFVRERLDVNGHYVELMRGQPRSADLSLPPLGEVRRIHRLVLKNHVLYHADPRKKRWRHELPYLRELYLWQERVLDGGSWPALCPAARDVAVVEPDGRVRGCELRAVLGELRRSGYDMGSILASPQAERERIAIEQANCSCTHCVYIYQTFAAWSLPSKRKRRLLERWFSIRGRLARVFR